MAIPTLVSATIGATGLTLAVVWSEAVTHGAGATTVANVYRGLSTAATYASGDGTTTLNYTFSSIVYSGEPITITGGVATSVSTSQNSTALDSQSATNSSAVTPPCTGRAAGMMVNSCTIKRSVLSQSATSAGKSTAWGVAYAGVCCSVQGASASEREQWATMSGDAVYRVYLSSTVDVLSKDRLTSFSGPSSLSSTTVLEVASDPLDHAGRSAYTMVMARSIQGNA